MNACVSYDECNLNITTGVRLYFQEASEPIPNFLMIRASQIESTGFNSTSPTRALWCQSANNDSNNGTWFQPSDFSMVSTEDIDSPNDEPYQMVTCNGQVGLVRDSGLASTDNIGLVQCMIRDEMNTTHTLTAGVYNDSVYDNYGEHAINIIIIIIIWCGNPREKFYHAF